MRVLAILMAIAAALWSAYWFVGAAAARRSIGQWLDQTRADGWVAEVADVDVAGFPNRFDITLTDIALRDPSGDVSWRAPFLQVLALSYAPRNVIVAFADNQTLTARGQSFAITAAKAQASAALAADGLLPLDHSTFVADGMTVVSDLGWSVAAEKLVLAIERLPTGPDTHRFGMDMTAVVPDPQTRALLGPEPALPQAIDRLHLDATVTFVAGTSGPRPATVTLADASLVWGGITISASGAVDFDVAGVADGNLTLRATRWRELLDIAVAGGLVAPGARAGVTRALEVVAGFSADPDRIELPLTLRGGSVFMGLLPLGPVPRLTF